MLANIDWGTVPTWVSAGSAVSALITAAVALIYARRTWTKSVDEARRKQADLVAAWVEKGAAGAFQCRVRNASNLPVYDVHVVVNGYGEVVVPGLGEWEAQIVPPADTGLTWEIPSAEAERTRGPAVVYGEIDTRGVLAQDLLAEIRFTDTAGRRWRRSDQGLLAEVKA